MKKQVCITTGLIVLALAFVVIGTLRGEDMVVWRKAVNICMECIGLG